MLYYEIDKNMITRVRYFLAFLPFIFFHSINCFENTNNFPISNSSSEENYQVTDNVSFEAYSGDLENISSRAPGDAIDNLIELDASYASSNFLILYESSHVSLSDAQTVASIYEDIRTTFFNMSFNYPILETGLTKFRVALTYSTTGSAATYHAYPQTSNTCASYIIHYRSYLLSVGVAKFKEVATHEYFHAIQNSYNRNMAWFAEASANWAKIIVNETALTCDYLINRFIEKGYALDSTQDNVHYGAAIFPLTLHRKFGNYLIIRKILEQYNNYSPTYSTSVFKEVVDNALLSVGSSDTFNSMLRTMHCYLKNTKKWLQDTFIDYNKTLLANPSGITIWVNSQNISRQAYASSYTYNYATTITNISYKTFVFKWPTIAKGTYTFNITYTGGDGYTEHYIINTSGNESFVYDAHGSTTFSVHNLGYTITDIYLILSNASLSNSASCTIKYTFYAYEESLTFLSSTRLIEKRFYLGANQQTSFDVSFSQTGQKIVQTFSSYDTKIEIYSNNTLVNNIVACDDAGYQLNSFAAFVPAINTVYSIKISFYSSTASGYIRMLINDCDGLIKPNHYSFFSFDDIWEISGSDSYSLYTYCTEHKSQLLIYTPLTSGVHTIEMESLFENYICIFDPDSSSMSVSSEDADAGGMNDNAHISKYLLANKQYLVFFSQYYPNATFSNLDTGNDVTIRISLQTE